MREAARKFEFEKAATSARPGEGAAGSEVAAGAGSGGLEHANRGDAGGPGVDTGCGVVFVDSA